jgi:ankyrin repeat protein
MGCCAESRPEVNPDEKLERTKYTSRHQFDMYSAIVVGDINRVKELVDKGFEINYNMNNFANLSPLHIAADIGSEEIVTYFIANGADANIKDTNDVTPIFSAVKNGHSKCVFLLIKGGADITIRTKYGNKLDDYIPKDQENKYKNLFNKCRAMY